MASRYRVRNYQHSHCRQTGKVCHASEYVARAELKRLVESDTHKNFTIEVYRCDDCRCWHVGHRCVWTKKK